MTLILDSLEAKIGRAEEHLQTIESEITAWSNRRPYSVVRQRNQEATRYSVVVRVKDEPALTRWALIAGDCIHGLRAALDYAVYRIAIHETRSDPPPDWNRLAFPIADSPDLFKDQRWRIRSLSPQVRAEIEQLQPYNRTDKELPPLLSLLRDFDDADKHRLLQVILAQPIKGEFRNVRGLIPGQPVETVVHAGAVVDGTEIVAFVVDRPTPNMDYEFSLDLAIVVSHAPGPKGHTLTGLRPLLRLLRGEVRMVIDRMIAVVP